MKLKWAKILFLLLALSASPNSFALMELGGNFGYKKQVYGSERENDLTSRTYSGSLAIYLFNLTGIELNFSYNEEINTQTNQSVDIEGSTFRVTGIQSRVKTNVYGVGIRQAFATQKSRIIPILSIGYAKQFIRDVSDYTFQDTADNSTSIVSTNLTKRREDSVFSTFSLKFRLTKRLALTGSVNTVFPAFETDKARDYIKYLAGFTWIL